MIGMVVFVQEILKVLVVVLNGSICPKSKGLCALMVKHLQSVHHCYASLDCLVTQATLAVVGGNKHKLTTLW